jgi:predicted Zn-dependent peptidase
MRVEHTPLDNGVRVVTAAIPRAPSVAVGLWVGVGGRHEPRELSGASHFLEHLLFKGTARRSARALSQAIEGRGGYLNAFTQEDSTCYYARVAAEHCWRALDVLMDMYLEPRLDPADITRERDVITEEILMYRDQPQHVVEELLADLLWQDHPVGRPLTGTPESLRGLTRERLLRYRESRYVPGNTVVAFAGPVGHSDCVRRTRRYLEGWQARKPPGAARVDGRVAQRRAAVEGRAIEQTHLALGVRLFGRKDPRRYALRLLSVILGENMSSRLFQIVREKRGLAYGVQSGVHLLDDTGTLTITAGLDRRRTEEAMELIVGEMVRLKRMAVGPGEFRRARDYAVGQLRLGMEGTSNQMLWAGENFVSYGRFVPPEEITAALQAVTPDAVRGVARQVFRPPRASLALVAPGDDGWSEGRAWDGLAGLGDD